MKKKLFSGLKDLPADLKLVLDASANRLKFGVQRNGFNIFEPRLSTCGRFDVEPAQHGLSDKEADAIVNLNRVVDELIEEGLNDTVASFQKLLGVKSGDLAGQFFSGDPSDQFANTMVRYAMLEIRWQREDMKGPME